MGNRKMYGIWLMSLDDAAGLVQDLGSQRR